jgi:SSS family solute:Na+ symporter
MIDPLLLTFSLVLYLIVLLLIVAYARKRSGKGLEEFYIGGRKITGFVAAMTYSATTYSVFMMVGLVGLTYAYGVGALGFELTYLMATLILLTLFAPRYWLLGKKKGYMTPAQLFSDRYENRYVGATMTLLSFVFLIPYMAIQAMGSAYLLEAMSGGKIPYFYGVTFVVVIMAISTFWGGFRGVAWTDAVQGIIMLASSLTLILYIFSVIGGFDVFAAKLEAEHSLLLSVPGKGFFNFYTFLTLTLPWAFFAITNPQVSQRLLIPKSRTSMKGMIVGFFIFGFLYTLISVMAGLQARALGIEVKAADKAMPMILQLFTPSPLALVVLIGIVSAGITTVNSIMLSLASLGGRDLYHAFSKKPSESKEQLIGYLIIGLEAIAVWLFALGKFGLISLLAVMASAGLLVQVPTIVGGLFWKRGTAIGALSSMIIGALVTAYLYLLGMKPLGPPVWAFPISVALYIILSVVTKPPEKASTFLKELSRWMKEEGFG